MPCFQLVPWAGRQDALSATEPRDPGRVSRRQAGPAPREAAHLGLNRAFGVPVVDVAAHSPSVHSCGERPGTKKIGVGAWAEEGHPHPQPLATLTLGSKQYAIAGLVAVRLAVVLWAG